MNKIRRFYARILRAIGAHLLADILQERAQESEAMTYAEDAAPYPWGLPADSGE